LFVCLFLCLYEQTSTGSSNVCRPASSRSRLDVEMDLVPAVPPEVSGLVQLKHSLPSIEAGRRTRANACACGLGQPVKSSIPARLVLCLAHPEDAYFSRSGAVALIEYLATLV